jgi:hypothetical protein
VFEEINPNRRYFLTTMIKTIAATQLSRLGSTKQHATPARAELPIEGELPSLVGATTWLNSQPLTVNELQRKSRAHQLLDLYLHQLAAPTPLCSRLG